MQTPCAAVRRASPPARPTPANPRSIPRQTLVKRAKYGDDAGADDMDAAFARNVAAKKKYKASELDPDEEYDNDGGLEM